MGNYKFPPMMQNFPVQGSLMFVCHSLKKNTYIFPYFPPSHRVFWIKDQKHKIQKKKVLDDGKFICVMSHEKEWTTLSGRTRRPRTSINLLFTIWGHSGKGFFLIFFFFFWNDSGKCFCIRFWLQLILNYIKHLDFSE